jgi:orsellinic acid C2-O-methyltransferase
VEHPSRTDAARPDDSWQRLRALIDANWTTQAIAATVRLRLPDLLMNGAQTVEMLASRASCHLPSLLRLLRALTSISIVSQREDGRFELTKTGRLLTADAPGSLSAWAELCGTSSWNAWARLYECVRTGTSARKQDSGAGAFDHLAKADAAALLFNRAMVGVSRPVAVSVAAEVDFAGVRRVVDVGGGFGELIAAVLSRHPEMNGVLLDMEHAIRRAHDHLAAACVADRCELVAGDFFQAVPPGADVYVLKTVLHDWDDEQCRAILINCAKAMSMDSRLLIVERVMPEHFEDCSRDRGIARGDLNMLIAQDGKERTHEEYRTLLRAASLRLTQSLALTSGFDVLTAERWCHDVNPQG